MTNKKFIEKLSNDLSPVKRIRFGIKEILLTLLVAFFTILAGIALSGVRLDLPTFLLNPRFLIETSVLIFLALLSTVNAFALSIPGNEKPILGKLTIATLFAWATVIIYALFKTHHPIAGWGLSCVKDIYIMGFIPAITLFIMVRRGAPLNRKRVGFAILTASGAYGALGTQLICLNKDPFHILVWHILPVILIGLVGIIIGKKLFSKL